MQLGCFYGGIVYIIKVFRFTFGPKERVKKQLSLDQYVKDSVSCFGVKTSLYQALNNSLLILIKCNICIHGVPGEKLFI